MITIRVSAEGLLSLISENRRWPGRFSCNERGQVWPVEYHGASDPYMRHVIDGNPLLDLIVDAVLASSTRGGKFQIGSDGVRLLATGQFVAAFALTREREPAAAGYL